ncbi:MAG: F0F1 ATP synthase subunit B [Gemmatimonadales bacterium]
MILPVLALLRAGEGGPTSPFEVNLGLAVWTWIVFLPLMWLLYKFAYPAILSATEAREKRIAEQLGEAERLNAEARTLLAEQQKHAAESRSTAQAMLAEAREVAEKERAATVEKTAKEQDVLVDRARREIAAERDKAILALRQEAVDVSLAAASKLIGQRLDGAADRKLVEEYLATLSRDG